MVGDHSESGLPANPQPSGPYGGDNNLPLGSKRRLGVLVGGVVGAVAAGLLGFWGTAAVAIVVANLLVVYLLVELNVEKQARRDLATDLSQAIHDGALMAEDLRRARGYEFVEARLEAAEQREGSDE